MKTTYFCSFGNVEYQSHKLLLGRKIKNKITNKKPIKSKQKTALQGPSEILILFIFA